MPWNDQNKDGGGWQGGGGGGGRGPWGRPSGGGSGGGGNQPPNLEDIIKRGQERIREIFPGGGQGGPGKNGILIVVGFAVVLFLAWSSFYRVDTDEQGIVLRFGNFVREEQAGLHMKLPYPIETVYTPVVTHINRVDIGMRDNGGDSDTSVSIDQESLMLTGDENIVDINFSVFWRINDATKYLFNVQNPDDKPDQTVKAMAESAMREVVGQSKITVLQTTGRDDAQDRVRQIMQTALDSYGAGIEITEVKLQKVDPPQEVIASFRDVQAARADQDRMQNEAGVYANTVVPQARGAAAKISQDAQAYRAQVVAEAQGDAKRFIAVYDSYKDSKDLTRRRMYLETMEEILGNTNKIVIDEDSAKGVLPYLPLTELKPKQSDVTVTTSDMPAPAQSQAQTPAVPTTGMQP